jgi:hypothetical protein
VVALERTTGDEHAFKDGERERLKKEVENRQKDITRERPVYAPFHTSTVSGAHYFVHYKGWKQTYIFPVVFSFPMKTFDRCLLCRWDEWVPTAKND